MNKNTIKQFFDIHVREKISIQQKMIEIKNLKNKVQIWSFKNPELFVDLNEPLI
jgi:hypothetical protein